MPSVVGRSTLAGGDAAAPSENRTAERLQRFQGTTPPVKKVSRIMATFRIPSHMVRSGAALPPRPLRLWADHPSYGDGLAAQLILERCDRLFDALVLAGYQPAAIYVQPGVDLPGETLAFENLDHLGYSIEHFDWTAKTGLPIPDGRNTLAVAIVLDERMRYVGAGPRFSVPLPKLTRFAPFTDAINANVVFTSCLTRPSVSAPAVTVLRTVQVEARPFDLHPFLGRQTASIDRAMTEAAECIFQDVFSAAQARGTWYTQPSDEPQPGLLPALIAPRWRFAEPWIEGEAKRRIQAFGDELFQAIEAGAFPQSNQLVDGMSIGDLLARLRGLAVPPPAARQLTEALISRLSAVNGQHYPPTGGPFDATEDQTCLRMLLMAHEIGIVDILGTSPATSRPGDVADVRAARLAFDVTGRYESRWNWALVTTYQPSGVGCLQINQVGNAIRGLWQTRAWRDQGAGEITAVQARFEAEWHDVEDEYRPILRFSLDNRQTWHGLMTFDLDDTDDSSVGGLHVDYGNVTIGSNDVGAVAIPDGICTMWDYQRVDTKPFVHEVALESLPPAVRARVEPLERTPLHLYEREQIIAALDVLMVQLQLWENASAGPAKLGFAAQADFVIGEAFAPYRNPADAAGLLVEARRLLIDRLLTEVIKVENVDYTAYLRAVLMASLTAGDTPHLRALLGLTTGQASGAKVYSYDWYLNMLGPSGDVLVGGGVFGGSMTITKKTSGKTLWKRTYGAFIAEYSKGLAAGVLISKATGGTVVSVVDWLPTDFNGPFTMWGVESGAIFFRYGWTGEVAFLGHGEEVLTGPSAGTNWALGIYGAVAEIGGGVGGILLGRRPQDVPVTTTVSEDYALQHAVLNDWAGAEAFFDIGQSNIRADVVPRLEEMLCDHLAAFMDAHGRLAIDGHASATGEDVINDPLSIRRAQAVCEAIRILLDGRMLIPEERIEILGYGEQGAPGGPEGPEVDSARRVDVFMDADLMIGYR